jgi:ATP-dependent helicase HrpB
VDPEEAARVLAEAAIDRFDDLLDEDAVNWLARHQLLACAMPELGFSPLDSESRKELLRDAARGRRTIAELKQAPWSSLLDARLDHAGKRHLREHAPEALVVPSGNRIRLQYEVGRPPVLAARLQELFGWTDTPRVAGGRVRVVLQLLGPNYRPVQITEDLRSFWSNTYFQVRKDLRGRYPKPSWPEDPLSAKPEAKGGRRSS